MIYAFKNRGGCCFALYSIKLIYFHHRTCLCCILCVLFVTNHIETPTTTNLFAYFTWNTSAAEFVLRQYLRTCYDGARADT